MDFPKLCVAVLYGGRSGEHEISLESAASVIRNLDRELYDVVPIGIDKEGRWHINDAALLADRSVRALPVSDDAPAVVLPAQPEAVLMPLAGVAKALPEIDVIFPVMHGPLCEDGAIQGFCELADIPYVGAGVLASAIGMDKDVAKRLAVAAGIPVVPWRALRAERWDIEFERDGGEELVATIGAELGWPVFVKPANMGSSVGVSKVASPEELVPALYDAFAYDLKVLIEKGVDAREIEVAVLESMTPGAVPDVSVPGEIIPTHEFYSYEAKYLDAEGAALAIPAELPETLAAEARRMARDIFVALECESMARVDLFLDRTTGAFYFNEINTIPGFTTISMFPKLWEASGLPYGELLTRLVDRAVERSAARSELQRDHRESTDADHDR